VAAAVAAAATVATVAGVDASAGATSLPPLGPSKYGSGAGGWRGPSYSSKDTRVAGVCHKVTRDTRRDRA